MADEQEKKPIEGPLGAGQQQIPKERQSKRPLTSCTSVPIPVAEVDRLTKETFDKMSVYLKGQLEGTLDEYKLLEDMNKTVTQRYVDMKQVAHNVTKSLDDLNDKYANIQPYLAQIDEIDSGTKRLEEAAYALDNYVRALETKFKNIEKR